MFAAQERHSLRDSKGHHHRGCKLRRSPKSNLEIRHTSFHGGITISLILDGWTYKDAVPTLPFEIHLPGIICRCHDFFFFVVVLFSLMLLLIMMMWTLWCIVAVTLVLFCPFAFVLRFLWGWDGWLEEDTCGIQQHDRIAFEFESWMLQMLLSELKWKPKNISCVFSFVSFPRTPPTTQKRQDKNVYSRYVFYGDRTSKKSRRMKMRSLGGIVSPK